MKAKYVACSAATQDVVWLKSFMYHLKIVKSTSDPVIIYYDNTTTVVVAKDPKYHGKTKHIKMRYHYIREAITKHDMILKHISTNSMIANPLTKPIARDVFIRHVRSLGLCRM
jgi:hypothetical protein